MHHLFEMYRAGQTKNFLICDDDGNLVGTMPEIFIQRYLQNEPSVSNDYIGNWMSKSVLSLSPDTSILATVAAMNKAGVAIAAVRGEFDNLWYKVDREMLADFAKRP